MFMDATSFNSDLSKWEVLIVEDMDELFHHTKAFNSDLSNWTRQA